MDDGAVSARPRAAPSLRLIEGGKPENPTEQDRTMIRLAGLVRAIKVARRPHAPFDRPMMDDFLLHCKSSDGEEA